jgi:NADH dehydrogenase/NADH:ubiquinone oxidoreductase subunit G
MLDIFIGDFKAHLSLLSKIILPASNVFEKKATYVNYLNSVCAASKIVQGPLLSRDYVDIIKVLKALFLMQFNEDLYSNLKLKPYSMYQAFKLMSSNNLISTKRQKDAFVKNSYVLKALGGG